MSGGLVLMPKERRGRAGNVPYLGQMTIQTIYTPRPDDDLDHLDCAPRPDDDLDRLYYTPRPDDDLDNLYYTPRPDDDLDHIHISARRQYR